MTYQLVRIDHIEQDFLIIGIYDSLDDAKLDAKTLCQKGYDGVSYEGWKYSDETYCTDEMGGGDPNYICSFGGYFIFKIPNVGYRANRYSGYKSNVNVDVDSDADTEIDL
jgi:hypothetical protein